LQRDRVAADADIRVDGLATADVLAERCVTEIRRRVA
jgi:hypothetical protein